MYCVQSVISIFAIMKGSYSEFVFIVTSSNVYSWHQKLFIQTNYGQASHSLNFLQDTKIVII